MGLEAVQKSRAAIRKLTRSSPGIGVVLGTGLCEAVKLDALEVSIPYHEIPDFPLPRVSGHAGVLHCGELARVKVAILAGRTHYYEGYDLFEITLPIRVLKSLGVDLLILTNAAGGLNPIYEPGDLMLLRDHLNLIGENPLRGLEAEWCERFVELAEAYDPGLRRLAISVARTKGLKLREGVYAALAGSSLETRAECRALRVLGADAVGMSTVPEVIVARQLGMEVLGISVITNRAGGPAVGSDGILARAKEAGVKLGSLIRGIVEQLREKR